MDTELTEAKALLNGADRPLTRDDILSNPDLPTDTVHVPRWGGTVLVKGMPTAHPRYVMYWSGGQKERLPPEEQQVRKMVGACVMSVLNPDTLEPLFTFKDVDELRAKHYNSVIKVAERAFQLAGNTEEEERQTVGSALLRVADYAQTHDWGTEVEDALADMINRLVAAAEEETRAPKAGSPSTNDS